MAIKIYLFCFLGFTICKAQEVEYSFTWEDQLAHSIQIEKATPQLKVKVRGASFYITGNLSIASEQSSFTPIIPFTNGLAYQAYNGEKLLFNFIPVPSEYKAPIVLDIFPQSKELPENLLKFYLVFDQPMETGKIYSHLHLLTGGKEIPNAFIPLAPELWDETHTDVTIWIDPGRIKRDLGPNKSFGQVLSSREKYTLVLDRGFKSRIGKPLSSKFEKSFVVMSRDKEKPTPNQWEILAPKAYTTQPLSISFNEPMDFALSKMSAIFIDSKLVEGTWKFTSDLSMNFIPYDAWSTGNYTIQIDPKAEDLAGNNFNRLFDTDLQDDQSKPSNEEILFLRFKIDK